MKKKILLIVAIALVGTVTLTLNNLRAQDQSAPSGPPPAGQAPPPGQGPGQGQPPNIRQGRPPRRGPVNNYAQAIRNLKWIKADLEKSTEDFDGHRQSAMDACDKAVQELNAVLAAKEAARKAAEAKAAAEQQNAQQTPAQAPAPATPQ
ncbi:MAG: hypothetical protein ACLQU4_05850 [Limisphaerales bacterium]